MLRRGTTGILSGTCCLFASVPSGVGVGATTGAGASRSSGSSSSRGLLLETPSFMGSSTKHNRQTTSRTVANLEKDVLTHVVPSRFSDHLCLHLVKALRWLADKIYRERYIHRGLMLIGMSCAGPLAVASTDHFRSIWGAKPPQGLRINLSHAENHRMHFAVLTALASPTVLDRMAMTVVQILHFILMFCISALSPRTAYRVLGYMGEESSVILTHMVNDIDLGKVVDVEAPPLAVEYWGIRLAEDEEEVPVSSSSRETKSATPQSNDHGSCSAKTSAKKGPETDSKKPTTASNTTEASSSHGTGASTTVVDETIATPHLRDIVLLMRADEMSQRDINHKMASFLESEALGEGRSTAFR